MVPLVGARPVLRRRLNVSVRVSPTLTGLARLVVDGCLASSSHHLALRAMLAGSRLPAHKDSVEAGLSRQEKFEYQVKLLIKFL